ncbi:folate-binding protein YgfZ [Catenulispora sp. NF23]|uniref:Folate-binding protein YgfZ n=1 Tax=Catenulispora pinistramenti TaxID=2705254 RepID=A0ABS5KX62_9ACTN|nr:glycine cleavage T C-terminal barrel domain-containing protein [Catenulispora pinistramenti]MBS2533915.1 folate-binding protein YgfZ [Catenulispora pinistramenti]MBS2550636.1 folate-binding protein YgfZ [Catenulispora pinistramenti]
MKSPLLTLPAAVPADPPDEGVAAHYGDPHGEQRRLAEERRGFVDLSHRGVLRVAGPDRLTWLHSFTSQHLEALKPGAAVEALILSPQGRVEHALYLVDDGTATWFHVEPGTAPEVLAFLEKMRFMMRVEPEDVTDRYALVLTTGPVPDGVLARETDLGRELFLPRERLADFAKDGGAGDPVGMWAYEALRVAAHRPRVGLETDDRTIPHELDWIATEGHPGAVHLNKGCYRGQETVARVDNLGHPPRRLVFLHLDGTPERLPAHGAEVTTRDGRVVGQVTSAARHYELGHVALAIVKRNTPVEEELLADGIPAAQEVVVAPDAGANRRPAFRAAH